MKPSRIYYRDRYQLRKYDIIVNIVFPVTTRKNEHLHEIITLSWFAVRLPYLPRVYSFDGVLFCIDLLLIILIQFFSFLDGLSGQHEILR